MTNVEVLATWMQYQPEARVVDLAAAINDVRVPEETRAAYTRVQEEIARHVDLRGALSAGLSMLQ